MATTSSLSLVTNIFTAPGEAFAALKERPRALLPLLVMLVGFSAVSFLYLKSVDMGWFLDNQLRTSNAQMTDAQREQAVAAATRIPPLLYGAFGAISSSVSFLIVVFIVAAYYTLMSYFFRDGVRLKQWFALLCWCSLPQVLGVIARLVNLTINDARFMPAEAIDPLSFGNLFGISSVGTSLVQRAVLGIDVTAVWTVVLSIIGYQLWTKSSWLESGLVVLGPMILIVAVGSIVALVR